MISGDAAYRAAREILRYRHHPERLRRNELVRLWAAATLEPADDDETLIRALNRDLADAIGAMAPRRSQLLRRCEIEGEPHRIAMSALGLSERHFYRERRAAIREVGESLQRVRPHRTISIGADRLALHLARIDALERAGRTDDALALLSHLRANATNGDASRIEVRLAEMNRDAGRFEAATGHVELALRASDAPQEVAEELRALGATIAWQAGQARCTAGGFERDVECLRERARHGARSLVPHALSDALEMSAEAALETGNWSRAVTLFGEAHSALARVPDPRSDVLVRSLIWVATARTWIAGALPAAAAELERAYAIACAQSLPREAALALGRFCQILDLAGNTKRALELATRHLEPAAAQLVGDWRAAAHLDVASMYLSAGRLTQAQEQVHQARAVAPPGSFAYAATLMHQSEICLALRDAPRTIEAATAACDEMERLGRSRHVGATLAARAEAKWMLGRELEAADEMNSALELMAGYAHPLRLAAAYRRATRITKNRRYARLARELSEWI
ncbi:MAG TPA: hypothetical protein VGI19_15055 [Candidatus Cybelea sp.]|jgi:hypothetical protein